MSKRDTFKRNILGLTRERSFAKAIAGWEIARDIRLPSRGRATACELCGTPFRSGALLRRAGTKSRKAVTITVGGTCLQTILLGSFPTGAAIARRKQAVISKLERTYGELLDDPGHWTMWLVEHVPEQLAPLAAQLRLLGIVSTDYALNKLIRFHDANRRYPTAALLPMRDGANEALPKQITIDEARAILKGMTREQWASALLRLSNDYRRQEIEPYVSDDWEWHKAWNRLTTFQRRAVVALDKLSSFAGGDEYPELRKLIQRLPPARTTPAYPFFVWSEKHGLALMEEPSEDILNYGEAWVYVKGDYRTIDLSTCRLIIKMTEERVLVLESEAFWSRPPWFRGRMTLRE